MTESTAMNAPVAAIEQLLIELPDLDWITDEGRVARLSQDFAWFSPVLNRQLKDKRADVVVRPRTESEIRAVVGACVRRKVPITIRGSGTGNYGQTTPLAGGVVLDMTGYSAMQWVRPGLARAQAGIRLGELEKQTRPSGQELRCVPSTYRSATLGGLFGGGFGGVGSINHGPLAAPGNVLGLRAMTIEAEPQMFELRGAEAMRMHHLWGTNGLVLELEVGLAPAHPWLETLITFDGFDAALAFGNALAHAPGIIKREVAFFGGPRARPPGAVVAALAAGLPCRAVAGRRVLRRALGRNGGRARRQRHLPQERRRGAEEQPHPDGVHVEPYDAACAQGRQDADLPAEQFRAGAARPADHRDGGPCWAARC